MWRRTPKQPPLPQRPSAPPAAEADLVELYRLYRKTLLPHGWWGLFWSQRTADEFRFGGFALPPFGLMREPRFLVNGVPAHRVDLPADSNVAIIAQRFGLAEPYEQCVVNHAVALAALDSSDTFRIQFCGADGRSFNEFHDWHVPPLAQSHLAETPQRVRVAATPDVAIFETMGFTAFHTLLLALRRYFERDYVDCHKILDWGCGCGRIARFFSELHPGLLSGIDIDPENANWCAANLRGGEFHTCGLLPPTPFPDESFDLIFGISVFTHLGESDQFAWLEEMRRLAAPGAAVIMSVHGNIASCRTDGDLHRLLALERSGFFTYGRCEDLDSVLPEFKESGYYKNVFHAKWYLHQYWARYFDILDVLDGAMAHQDLVVMRRR